MSMQVSKETGKGKAVTLWVVSVLLAAMFLFAGGSKLAGAPMHVEHFHDWGYPDWFRLLIGVAELAGGIGLLVPRLATPAAGGLVIVMIGAVYTHVAHQEVGQAVVPAVLGVLLAIIVYARLGAFRLVLSHRS